jgi:2-polyprenyl-6-methoxyphenol hydroxylase-like FAD-dependent oxidoreductase
MTGRTRMSEDASVAVVRDLVVSPADSPLRVAIVGAGPAGVYAAEALAEQDAVPVAVDIIDRLPTPFGLVRYGIAPDHLKMRGLRATLQRTLDHPRGHSAQLLGVSNAGRQASRRCSVTAAAAIGTTA